MPTSADGVLYLDASALVKLVVREAESDALGRYVGRRRLASCALVRTEVIRAARPHGEAAVVRARRLIERLDIVQVEDALLDSAAFLGGTTLRSLDAIHLAAAQTLASELTAVITYDGRMALAARELGLPTQSPS